MESTSEENFIELKKFFKKNKNKEKVIDKFINDRIKITYKKFSQKYKGEKEFFSYEKLIVVTCCLHHITNELDKMNLDVDGSSLKLFKIRKNEFANKMINKKQFLIDKLYKLSKTKFKLSINDLQNFQLKNYEYYDMMLTDDIKTFEEIIKFENILHKLFALDMVTITHYQELINKIKKTKECHERLRLLLRNFVHNIILRLYYKEVKIEKLI